MSELFTGFTDEVCRFVKHATPEEKKDISGELRAHMEDHAEDLAGRGYSKLEAARKAVDTMGSPGEIGAALDRQYPFVWLFLSRASAVIALVLAVLLFLPILVQIGHAASSLRARFNPMSEYNTHHEHVMENPIDIRREGSSDDIVYFYGADVEGENAYIAVAFYDRNPFKGVNENGIVFKGADETEERVCNGGGFGSYNFFYDIYIVPVKDGEDYLMASYDLHGTSFEVRIPLKREAAA